MPTPDALCPTCRTRPPDATAQRCDEHGLFLIEPAAFTRQDDAPLLGYILDGKYALVDFLGGGGYGSIYLGLQQPLGREVAVKLLRGLALNNGTVRELFEREALALARLSSPYTVRLIDYGVTREGPVGLRNLPYMVMERLAGEDLERRLLRGPLAPEEVSQLLVGIVDSLAEAHAHGVIHRDLKPSNVLLVPTRQGGWQPKVIDFGIARLERPNRSPTGMIMGTPEYMAPEQVRGGAAMDHRVDQYALGVMVFELLTARVPFLGDDAVAILTQHATQPPPPLTYLEENVVFGRLSPVIQRAMAKTPEARFPDVEAFRHAFDTALYGDVLPAATGTRPPASRTVMQFSQPVPSAPPVSPEPPITLAPPPAAALPATPLVVDSAPPRPAELVPTIVLAAPPVAPVAAPRGESKGKRAVVALVGLASLGALAALVPGRSGGPSAPGVATAAVPSVEPSAAAPSAAPSVAPVAAPPAEPSAAPSAAPPAVASAAPSAAPVIARPAPPDPRVATTAAAVEAELHACRCAGAQRLIQSLAGLRGGAARADALRGRLGACRPIDVDHKCVDGRLVLTE